MPGKFIDDKIATYEDIAEMKNNVLDYYGIPVIDVHAMLRSEYASAVQSGETADYQTWLNTQGGYKWTNSEKNGIGCSSVCSGL